MENRLLEERDREREIWKMNCVLNVCKPPPHRYFETLTLKVGALKGSDLLGGDQVLRAEAS